MSRLLHLSAFFLLLWTAPCLADDPTRVLPLGQKPKDARLGKPRDLNGYFPLTPPTGKDEWTARRRNVRNQVLVANGLWPMPEKAALRPVIHGKIDRDDYTVEKVFFASYPGHYVTGNLYRPKGKTGKLAGVLCPHGHWQNGRFYEANDAEVQKQLAQKAEKTPEGARYPLQARCAQLARMGCVVFHYDMVGVADSKPIGHTAGFTDVEAELRLQSFMGLQTFNSIRALDFLLSLPEVDPERIGVTGASGGGTQTFILCAIDDRPAVAFPAVMISTAMQGGCICENCSYLRQGTGNIELAGLFAKPLAMTGADDWTKEIETKGLPELKALYRLLGAEDKVMAKCFPQFGHNYNQVSREVMYNWFNQHLRLGHPESVEERPFVPVPPKELSVYDEEHPRPSDAADAPTLRRYMTELSDKQIATVHPKDSRSLEEFRELIGPALWRMIGDRLHGSQAVAAEAPGEVERDGVHFEKLLLGRKGENEQIPAVFLSPVNFAGTVVVWIHPQGKASLLFNGKLSAAARKLLDAKAAILAPDVFLTGEFLPAEPPRVQERYAGYTFGYNRPLVANRVHDILTAVSYAMGRKGATNVDLVGWEMAGPWVVMARALCGDGVRRTAADLDGFRFDRVKTVRDEMMLPGAIKYGGLPAFTALCFPYELYLANEEETGAAAFGRDAYRAANAADQLTVAPGKANPEKMVQWLVR